MKIMIKKSMLKWEIIKVGIGGLLSAELRCFRNLYVFSNSSINALVIAKTISMLG